MILRRFSKAISHFIRMNKISSTTNTKYKKNKSSQRHADSDVWQQPNKHCLLFTHCPDVSSTLLESNVPLAAGVETGSSCFQSSSVSCRRFSRQSSWKHLMEWHWCGCEFGAVWCGRPTRPSQSDLLHGTSRATAGCPRPEHASSDMSVMPAPSHAAPDTTEHTVPPTTATNAEQNTSFVRKKCQYNTHAKCLLITLQVTNVNDPTQRKLTRTS